MQIAHRSTSQDTLVEPRLFVCSLASIRRPRSEDHDSRRPLSAARKARRPAKRRSGCLRLHRRSSIRPVIISLCQASGQRRLTCIAMHRVFKEVSHSTISWPPACNFVTVSRNTRAIGGRGLTTPSSGTTPITRDLDEKASNMSFLQGIGGSCESNFQCSASITSFVTVVIELKDLVIGPIADGTCC